MQIFRSIIFQAYTDGLPSTILKYHLYCQKHEHISNNEVIHKHKHIKRQHPMRKQRSTRRVKEKYTLKIAN